MMAGFPASYFCIKAFSETDLTEDLGRFDIPTLVLHGDDDQIVPIGASAMLSSKMIKGATLKVYQGAPHGMCTTLKDRVNAELLAFLEVTNHGGRNRWTAHVAIRSRAAGSACAACPLGGSDRRLADAASGLR